MAITARLAPALGRHAATVIVLGFFNHWIAATAEVDTHSGRHFFGLGLVLDEVGRKAKEIRITHGSREEISNDLGGSSSIVSMAITARLAPALGRCAGIRIAYPRSLP
jgi:hypothetical protein